MRVAEVRKFCKLDETGGSLVRAAMSQLNLSARAYHRILKLARTIADLAGSEPIQTPHLAERCNTGQRERIFSAKVPHGVGGIVGIPGPCGYYGDNPKPCICSPSTVT
jgi:hypothetical protein